jgi:hypothetical protein
MRKLKKDDHEWRIDKDLKGDGLACFSAHSSGDTGKL